MVALVLQDTMMLELINVKSVIQVVSHAPMLILV